MNEDKGTRYRRAERTCASSRSSRQRPCARPRCPAPPGRCCGIIGAAAAGRRPARLGSSRRAPPPQSWRSALRYRPVPRRPLPCAGGVRSRGATTSRPCLGVAPASSPAPGPVLVVAGGLPGGCSPASGRAPAGWPAWGSAVDARWRRGDAAGALADSVVAAREAAARRSRHRSFARAGVTCQAAARGTARMGLRAARGSRQRGAGRA